MKSSSETYHLDKWVWTNDDFDEMGWHDSLIYAFKVDKDLYFDLDYIFEWVEPQQGLWFSFWIAPCTLIFETPRKFSFNFENKDFDNYLEISDVYRQINQNNETEWRIETNVGDILIEAENFRQIVRRLPTKQPGQHIIPEERGEISFATSFDKDFKETERVKEIKQNDFLLRQKAARAQRLQKDLAKLFTRRLKGEIDTKLYILQKRELEQQVKDIKRELKDNGLEPFW